jgi:hypothetical protein
MCPVMLICYHFSQEAVKFIKLIHLYILGYIRTDFRYTLMNQVTIFKYCSASIHLLVEATAIKTVTFKKSIKMSSESFFEKFLIKKLSEK